jgi:hypothetical protein
MLLLSSPIGHDADDSSTTGPTDTAGRGCDHQPRQHAFSGRLRVSGRCTFAPNGRVHAVTIRETAVQKADRPAEAFVLAANKPE